MDFNFTDEQKQLADGLRKYISKECGFEERRKIIHSKTGESDKIWKGFVDLGLLALPISEEFGGLSGTPVDMIIVMQEFGKGLVVGPYFSTVFGAHILQRSLNASKKQSLLPKVAEGSCRLAVAFLEKEGRHELNHVGTKATAKGESFSLFGEKSFVFGGATTDYFIVSARLTGEVDAPNGLMLFLVAKDAPGVSLKDYRTIDGYRACEVTLKDVTVSKDDVLFEPDQAWEMIDESADYANTLLCAQAIGAMDAMCKDTIEYSKTRKQFGQPIGKFQILQHRMVDMFIHLEQARSMAYLASIKVSSADKKERRRIVSAAKVRVGQASKFVAQQAVQTYGGMGMSDEVPISHYFKRLAAIELMLGDTDYHLARFIENEEKR